MNPVNGEGYRLLNNVENGQPSPFPHRMLHGSIMALSTLVDWPFSDLNAQAAPVILKTHGASVFVGSIGLRGALDRDVHLPARSVGEALGTQARQ